MVLEYYLTGGHIQIGKKEMAFELLRPDSILRSLLGYGAGKLETLASRQVRTETQGDSVLLDFSRITARKFDDNPEAMLQDFKRRYGSAVGGKLHFRCIYTTFEQAYYLEADLDADEVTLRSPN